MTTIIELFISALAVAYVLGAIDAYFDVGKLKGFVALPFAVGVLYLMGYLWIDIVILAPASAFVALAITMLLDRPQIVQTRRFL